MANHPERQKKPPVEMAVGASLVLVLLTFGVLAMATDLPDWAALMIASAIAGTVERAGQWWYGRNTV